MNYPKGQGEHFAAWLRVNKPGTALYHVVGAQGSRHNLCLEAAPAIYMNRYVCFDYASYLLRLPKKQDNILLRCLFVLMTSKEIIAQSRLYAILYISFCVPIDGWQPRHQSSESGVLDQYRLVTLSIRCMRR